MTTYIYLASVAILIYFMTKIFLTLLGFVGVTFVGFFGFERKRNFFFLCY